MTNLELAINQTLPIVFTAPAGQTTFASTLLIDGVLTPATLTYTEVSSGVYRTSYTFTSTGVHAFVINGSVAATVNVVTRDKFSYLENIEDEALGSWSWDKKTNSLTLLRQNGTTLATFTATNLIDSASRERIS